MKGFTSINKNTSETSIYHYLTPTEKKTTNNMTGLGKRYFFYNKYYTTTQKKIEVMHSARKVPPESSKELFSYRTVNAWNKLTVEIRNSTPVSYDDFHVYMNPQ